MQYLIERLIRWLENASEQRKLSKNERLLLRVCRLNRRKRRVNREAMDAHKVGRLRKIAYQRELTYAERRTLQALIDRNPRWSKPRIVVNFGSPGVREGTFRRKLAKRSGRKHPPDNYPEADEFESIIREEKQWGSD